MSAIAPLGIFDSGLGGLTVVRAVLERLPAESVLYLGDTARVPYGSKSALTVTRYAQLAARFLIEQRAKAILVACNTASAHALEALRATLSVPVIGAVEPGAQSAAAATKSGSIAVIGTLGTIASLAYPRALHRIDPGLRVTARACPLLVPLAEEGWLDDEIAEAVARRYLGELAQAAPQADVLLLGCTHYPLLRNVLHRVACELFDRAISLVDSAIAMAEAAANIVGSHPFGGVPIAPGLRCYITDDARIAEVGARFLGRPLEHVERVDL